MSTMSSGPILAVQASNPLSGVKRPNLGNPTQVSRGLPAFRGANAAPPGGSIKVPKLSNSNRPNRGTNVTIPLARVSPLKPDHGVLGRVAPGDVVFTKRVPTGYWSKQPVSSATASMNDVIGLDSLNKRLHGATALGGWQLGVNCFTWRNGDPMASPFVRDRREREDERIARGAGPAPPEPRVLLSELEDYTCDGVVIFSEQEEGMSVGNNRQNVVFNIAAQGKAQVNNGFLGYATKRKIEAYPRGSIESALQSSINGYATLENSWVGKMRDYPTMVAGTYTMYPTQMFDRSPQMLDTLYVGLRVYKLSLYDTTEGNTPTVRIPAPTVRDEAGAILNRNALTTARLGVYYVQYIPFSGRKANLIRAAETIRGTPGLSDDQKREDIAKLGRIERSYTRTAIKPEFDESEFDAIRSDDFRALVGAWNVGRIMDVKSAKHSAYDSGPADTGIALSVDVQLAWLPLLAPTFTKPAAVAPRRLTMNAKTDPAERLARGLQMGGTLHHKFGGATKVGNDLFGVGASTYGRNPPSGLFFTNPGPGRGQRDGTGPSMLPEGRQAEDGSSSLDPEAEVLAPTSGAPEAGASSSSADSEALAPPPGASVVVTAGAAGVAVAPETPVVAPVAPAAPVAAPAGPAAAPAAPAAASAASAPAVAPEEVLAPPPSARSLLAAAEAQKQQQQQAQSSATGAAAARRASKAPATARVGGAAAPRPAAVTRVAAPSTVSSVFASVFGGGDTTQPQPQTHPRSPSPTPSSGSEGVAAAAASSGPKSTRRSKAPKDP